ncbi:MAG: 1,4-dihydroxy-2-naphthoate polyprenyltransferase [Myxococcaceae bacterium]|jgi:1,4-dihydroxy-2-naphthoate octaprenyltransferase|nr:1,4-dihydroxy-2-naphthoate polyprenyltransferase [Myxococcaceae bacterium]
MTALSSAPPSPLAAWALATRPKTLVAGFVPVAVGLAVSSRLGPLAWLPALGTLVGALLIQVGTNLFNDAYDFERGADTTERLGPPRATQQGWLSPSAVMRGAITCFALAFLVGLWLVWVSGWPLLVVGVVSLLAGYAYTGGPFPLAYHGLGDVFVLVFFGLVAVAGTVFVQTQTLSPLALLAGLPVGALGVALLAVNNVRDEKTDAAANKRTLVVRLGVGFGRAEYLAMVALAMLVPVALWAAGLAPVTVLAALLALPLAVKPVKLLFTVKGPALNQALAATAKLQLVYGLLFAVGLSR